MSRFDLTKWNAAYHESELHQEPTLVGHLFDEATRAQASEDALKERVRVLENAIELAMQQHGRADIAESQKTLYAALNALAGGKEKL